MSDGHSNRVEDATLARLGDRAAQDGWPVPGPARARRTDRFHDHERLARRDLREAAAQAGQATLAGGSTGAGKARVWFAGDGLVSVADRPSATR
jgi:hypothetical protein